MSDYFGDSDNTYNEDDDESRGSSEVNYGEHHDDANDEIIGPASLTENEIESSAMVYLRLKPIDDPSSAYEITEEGNILITYPSTEKTISSTNKCKLEKHYSFSKIFRSHTVQRDIYESCIKNKIEFQEDFTVLTYGTSGSGKTFTLLGSDEHPGIIPRALENIFTCYKDNIYSLPAMKLVNGAMVFYQDDDTIGDLKYRQEILNLCESEPQSNYNLLQEVVKLEHNFETYPEKDVSVCIWMSFVEIYNENLFDLLTIPKKTAPHSLGAPTSKNDILKIVCNNGKVFIKGLTKVFVKSSEEALKLLKYGLKRATYASTGINANSSRSHCIFFIDILKYHANSLTEQTCFKFCDLAGSERMLKTGNVGSRMKESQRINTSLMVLGRCLDAANNNRNGKKEVIPFRESKLTMLLQTSLLGKESLTMIVNLTPSEKYYEENLNVLNFASIAKNIIFKKPLLIKNKGRYSLFKNSICDTYAANDQYNALLEENIYLRSELERLRAVHELELLQKEQEIRNQVHALFKETLESTTKRHEERLQTELKLLERRKNDEFAVLKRKYEEQIEDLRDELDELTIDVDTD